MSRYAALTGDPQWKLLKATDRRHMRVLLELHNPRTGYLKSSAQELTELLETTEETLRRSRRRLIEVGLIVSYEPGSGRRESIYRLARSWPEAEKAAGRQGGVA